LNAQELYQSAHNQLSKVCEINEAKAIIKILISEMTHFTFTEIMFGKDLPADFDFEKFNDSLDRLLKNEPIQYILGKAPFLERDFFVQQGVLIPRPETEELVVKILADLPANAQIMDIGTGSGCIAISLALANNDYKVFAVDVSEEVIPVVTKNKELLQANNLNIIKANILTEVEKLLGLGKFDCIVSNPPYVTEAEKNLMKANVLDYEPDLALFVSNENPLLFYNAIADAGLKLLKPGGQLWFEINEHFGKETCEMLIKKGYQSVSLFKDFHEKDRMVKAVYFDK
jgi:release factor glutamine methyltransferase